MFCTCSRSSMQTPPGRQSSRRLQLEQLTSCLCGTGWFMNRSFLSTLSATTTGMASPLLLHGGAVRDHVAHSLEVFGLVEKRPRAETLGDLAVGVGGIIGQHHDLELGRLCVQRAKHVEARAL